MEIFLLILIVVVFLGLPVMSMRKQSKQINEIKSFQSQLEPGMIVQMTSGIHARIAEVGTTTVDVELAPGVTTTWDRSAVLKLVETPDTVDADDTEGADAAEQVDESTFEDFDTVAPFEDQAEGTRDERDSGDADRPDSGDTPRS
ncbi:Preprotein translocase SecN subunit [Corynebacterium glyciniphilum AJ 3170]|uniref:Preprotein translocase SecN subunit n=1 Tax=Corynebacterium glyciniphilum AJ 3170 TaxID=1404245 RepID=X5DLT2_9CORY|nr:preprotein translocase subunit YajC [Corynebacterium glyciniphilum]AHW64078.1 Preprotein translocase SecN subunit [Corynebacterium glyciniphilum AJ 3170]